MIRRGPDGAGMWLSEDGLVGLGHRRLAIIDPTPSGAQPMAAFDGRLRITFNGEIYNYRELRRELEGKGRVFRSSSDTEVLLHLYDEHGPDMVHRLRGMYAFAIWDAGKRGLFVARDPFGIKPLYYCDDRGSLRFASQVKALLRGGAVAADADLAGQVGFLTWGFVPEPFTLYRGIRSLPAGSHMWIDASGRREPRRFFSVRDEFAKAEELARSGGGTSIEDVVEGLADSVRHHMVADVPVAAFLSAGLDSATTVALASRVEAHNLRTLTLGFREYQGKANDETSLAALISARFGATHETRWVRREEFEAEIEHIFEAMDQPSTDGVNTYLVSQAAAGAGMKVALSGLGGDELFAGYPSFRDVPRIRRFVAATGVSPSLGSAIRACVSPLLRRLTSPKYSGLLEYGGSNAGAYLLRRGLFMPWELPEVMDPEMAARGWDELNMVARLEATIAGLRNDRSIVSTLEIEWYMRNQLLRDSDWAGMAHSVEIRVPYMDVDFFRCVLPAILSSSPPSKAHVARRLKPPLPDEVLRRSKTGFLVPVQQWCTAISGSQDPSRGLRGWAAIVIGRHLGSASPDGAGTAKAALPGGKPARHPTAAKRGAARCAAAAYRILNFLLAAMARALWPRPRPRTVERICIFRIGNIGDIVCALPAMRAVRDTYPDAHITLLTSPGRRGMPGAADVLEGTHWIDDINVYHAEDIDTHPKRRRLLAQLRALRFDLWIDLPNNLTTVSRQFRDMAFARMTGVKWARGWCVDTIKWAAQAQSECLLFPNEVERTLDIVRRLGMRVDEVRFDLASGQPLRQALGEASSPTGAPSRKLIAIAPGAKRSTNLWFPERFVAVGRELAAQGHRILLLGGATEKSTCEQMAAAIGSGAESFAGRLSVVESCEVLRRCELAICVDSGIQHLASAVGTPVVSLFSFWQMPGKWRPYGERNLVIQKWVPCHTCLLDVCPRGNLCMARIEVPEVVAAARAALRAREPATADT